LRRHRLEVTVGTWEDNLRLAKQVLELLGAVWQRHQLFLEWDALEKYSLAHDIGPIRALFERASVAVIMRASE